MIAIVDFGMGNLGSLRNMFKRIGVDACVMSAPKDLATADKLVLPGVGAFSKAMQQINSSVGLREILDRKALIEKTPILGVCLGMQLLTSGSEEGGVSGLGWISGQTKRFSDIGNLKVPHMGWNVAEPQTPSLLTQNLESEPRFYFVHSYYVIAENRNHSIMQTKYGIQFDSAIGYENIYGVQFHPEKSHKYGLSLLENFVRI